MFYDGDLQAGINLSIQESKLVACFVRDDEEESVTWENDYLTDAQIAPLLAEKTVLLRLQAGSQEAGYLAAIFPLPKTPSLVIIQNGQLKEYLNVGVSKQDFLQRVKTVLDNGNDATAYVPASGAVYGTPAAAPASEEVNRPAAAGPQSPAVQALLEERRARLEAEKKKKDAAEKAERASRAAAQQAALDVAAASDPKKAADRKYALLQKKRQKDAREERERILKLVEDDKAERKAKEVLRKEQAKASAAGMSQGPTFTTPSSTLQRPTRSKATECAIQVRLFDGTTIRSRFPSHNSLGREVREWVDGQSVDGDVPYNFKQILTPLPNRTISISEEEETLENLGLTPSATLILVPIKDFTSAYESGATGYLSRGLSAGFGLVSSGVGLVTGTLGGILGSGPSPEVVARQDNSLGPDRRTGEHQLYNGNAQNLVPRPDDTDKQE